MSEQTKICQNCQTDVTQAVKDGIARCPACGADLVRMSEIPLRASPQRTRSPWLFWIMLLAPALLSLLSFSAGRVDESWKGAGFAIGFGALIVGAVGSIYCGIWLAIRFCQAGATRVLVGCGIALALVVVNLFIAVVGCAGNLTFH